jgi:hypothetical protein
MKRRAISPLDRRHATAADAIMALPRYLVTDGDTGR